MSMIKKLPSSISSMPPLGKGKDANPEDELWRWLMLAVYKHKVPIERSWTRYCTFSSLAGQGSDNWPLMACAIWALSYPEMTIDQGGEVGRISARDWWLRFFRWQLGIFKDAPGDVRYFGLSEVFSNTYDGMNAGSILAVRLWAHRTNDVDLLDLTAKWLKIWVAGLYLGSGGEIRRIISHTVEASAELKLPKKNFNLLALSQIGGRSTPLHYIDDPRQILFSLVTGYPNANHPWIEDEIWNYWFVQIAEMLLLEGGDFGDCGKNLSNSYSHIEVSNVTFKGEFTFTKWDDGTILSTLASPINGNSGAVIATLIRPDGTVENFYPWKGKNLAKPKGMTGVEINVLDNVLSISSSHGHCQPVQLPNSSIESRFTLPM